MALDKQSGRDVWASKGISAGPEYSSCLAVHYEGASLIVTGTKEGLVAVNARNQQQFVAVLEKRLVDLSGSPAARVKKVIKEVEKR